MSWQLRAAEMALKTYGAIRGEATPGKMQQAIDKSRRKPPRSAPNEKESRGLEVTSQSIDGITVYSLKPDSAVTPKHQVVYLHGGSYTFEISTFHWRFVGELARTVPAQITVPIYVLAPESTAGPTVAAMTDLTEAVIREHGSESVTLMGDSAGGGMALAVAMQLRDRGVQPYRTVLISPWMDVTFADPESRAIEPRDVMLSVDGLTHCGKAWAGDLDPTDPRVSPIFGDLKGLAPLEVYMGTHDIFWADIPRLRANAAKAGTDLRLHEGPKMPHVYPILPVPEGRVARDEIIETLRG